MKKKVLATIGYCLLAVVFLIFARVFVESISDCVRYARLYKDPVEVEAVVIHHDSYEDSEGDTTYYSYISYTVDGVEYSGIRYQSDSSRSDLAEVGAVISVDVNPENHGELLKDVADPVVVVMSGSATLMGLAMVFRALRRRGLSKGLATADRDTVRRDLCIIVRGRGLRVFWLLLCIMLVALHFYFPMLFGDGYLVAAIVAGIFWLICMRNAVREWKRIQHDEFRIVFDHVIKKEVGTDSDGDPTYELHFSTAGRSWEKSVSRKEYYETKVGSSVQAVYLAGDTTPFLHYDFDGNPCE